MNVSIHEENSGTLVLANTKPPQYAYCSKHYAISTNCLREQIITIDTNDQLGDVFTKSLPKVTFEHL
ncbi:hypothetical protein ACHAXS_002313 [Conticribra weissflogii]